MKIKVGKSTLELAQGDITAQDTDAIVNAANSSLLGGGGVDGAIHRAGGPQILEECRNIGGCPTGAARITSGGKLKARYVIHTVGPIFEDGTRGEPTLLANAYRSSLTLASSQGIASIAFPSISTGAYGYPMKEAATIALETVCAWMKAHQDIKLVRFVLFGQRAFDVYAGVLADLGSTSRKAVLTRPSSNLLPRSG